MDETRVDEDEDELNRLAAAGGETGAAACFQLARACRARKEKEKAVEHLTRGAELGSIECKLELASSFEKGTGVSKSVDKAVQLWREVADRADCAKEHRIAANMNLGRVHTFGKAVEKDEAAGFSFFKAAALLGDSDAIANVGSILTNAQGVEQNDKESFEWFQRGAATGHAFSLFCVAAALKAGRGVAKNGKEAIKFYKRAANAGSRDAAMDLSILFKTGDGVKRDQASAEFWMTKGLSLTRSHDVLSDGVKRPMSSCLERIMSSFDLTSTTSVDDVLRGASSIASDMGPDRLLRIIKKACATCGGATDLKSCGGCASVWYCGFECQQKHWKEHKATCKKNKKSS
jgi:TPR repeat protein